MSTARLTGTRTKIMPIKIADENVPILNSSGCEVCWKGCVLTTMGSFFTLVLDISILQENIDKEKGNSKPVLCLTNYASQWE
jgi:hypothetical protein